MIKRFRDLAGESHEGESQRTEMSDKDSLKVYEQMLVVKKERTN